jgi:hypothetical protein
VQHILRMLHTSTGESKRSKRSFEAIDEHYALRGTRSAPPRVPTRTRSRPRPREPRPASRPSGGPELPDEPLLGDCEEGALGLRDVRPAEEIDVNH